MKFKHLLFNLTNCICSAQELHVAGDYHIGIDMESQSPCTQKALLDTTD